MESAEQHARQPVEQPRAAEPPRQPATIEEIIDQCPLGEHAKAWLHNHKEYVTDPVRNQQLVLLHDIAKRKSGAEYTPRYFQVMDDLLGFEPAGNGRHLPPNEPASPPYNGAPPPRAPMPTPRQPAPQRFASQPPAAPPTRENTNMRTGRPQSDSLRATELDRHYAQIAGISIEEYMAGKRRMIEEKKAGLHGGG
jgi:hypothetical protein